MGNTIATVELKDLAPVRADERKELNLARKVTHKQFKKASRFLMENKKLLISP